MSLYVNQVMVEDMVRIADLLYAKKPIQKGAFRQGWALAMASLWVPRVKCLTPGSQYTIEIHGDECIVKIKLPFEIQKEDVKKIENNLHNGVELALSGLF
jgi:hypothetical protein